MNKEYTKEQWQAIAEKLAEKACQCSEARAGYCSYMDDGCITCIQNRNMPRPQDFIEQAKKELGYE